MTTNDATPKGLTFMPTPTYLEATSDVVRELPVIDERRLNGNPPRRRLLVPENIGQILSGVTPIDQSPYPKFTALLSQFQAGHLIKVSISGLDTIEKKPFLERLTGLDEVWVMCFREPKSSQWRLFGRFTSKDTFLALRFHSRGHLGTTENYSDEAGNFIGLWSRLFPLVPVLRGTTIDDYISEPFQDVDNPF